MKTLTIKASDIVRCPRKSFLPRHYNADGSCKCSKAEHAAARIAAALGSKHQADIVRPDDISRASHNS